MKHTLTHSEDNKGWTSFWEYFPDWFLNINNKFLTIKNGQLWLQNDESNSIKNNFYDAQKKTSIKTVFNEAMAEDKIFKTLVQESNEKWRAILKTNLTEGEIKQAEFNTRESRQFSFIRGNETTGTLHGNAAHGIGVIISSTGSNIVFSSIPDLVSVGDVLHQINGSEKEIIGTINNINKITKTISVDAITTTPINGLYTYALKNSRVEGEEMRGYYMEVTLENEDTTDGELFAISTNAVKSYV
jgi:hypothetical protein